MELYELIPNNSTNWSVSSDFLFWKKYQRIPVCFIDVDKTVHIFLDNRIPKPVIKLTKFLIEKNIKFYFTTPELSHPSGIYEDEYVDILIKHYLLSYANKDFFNGFNNINFDLMKNMTDLLNKIGCIDKIKPIFDLVQKEVLRKGHDWYARVDYYDYNKAIREEFQTLYRQIQINQII